MKRFAVVFILTLCVVSAFAWGPDGHRSVEQVAYDKLDWKDR